MMVVGVIGTGTIAVPRVRSLLRRFEHIRIQIRLKEIMADLSTGGGLNTPFRQAVINSGHVANIQQQLDVLPKRLNS